MDHLRIEVRNQPGGLVLGLGSGSENILGVASILGDLDYKRTLAHEPRSAVQTFALAGGPAVDHLRIEVRDQPGGLG